MCNTPFPPPLSVVNFAYARIDVLDSTRFRRRGATGELGSFRDDWKIHFYYS